MKNLKYIIAFFLILSLGMISKAYAQDTFTQGSVSSGPYSGGQIITIPYQLDFTMVTQDKAQIKFTYNTALFDFLSSNLTNSSNSVWVLSSSLPGVVIFQTDQFDNNENGFTSGIEFTISFRVISPSCNPIYPTIKAEFSTIRDGNQNILLPPIITPITIQNTGSIPTVSIELIQGDDCNIGMYKISSFGYDINATTQNSTFKLVLPTGATLLNVFKTDGSLVTLPTPSVTSTTTTYTWARSGIQAQTSQTYYALIKYDKTILCQTSTFTYNLSLDFISQSICPPFNPVTTHINRVIANCCGPIPPGDGQDVFLSKSLAKYPLRYFPAPDNCKTHDYIIKVDNLSAQSLEEFKLEDFLNDIIPNFSNEIEVTKIQVSFNSIFPNSEFRFVIDLGGQTLDKILTSGGSVTEPRTAFGYTTPFFPDDLHRDLVIKGSSPFPQFSSLIVKITHRLGVMPSVPYNNFASLDYNIGNNHFSKKVNLESQPDKYEPSITLEKKVRILTGGGGFSNNVIAIPGQTVEFRIKIRNYGMMSVESVSLKDIITNNPANMFNVSSVVVSGSGYTPGEILIIQNSINSSLNGTGFDIIIPKINAAPCISNTELEITTQATIKTPDLVLCAIPYINHVNLSWDWKGPKSLQSEAIVNFDLYKNILFQLKAKCALNAQWQYGQLNAVPGNFIWYEATVKNTDPDYAIPNLKILLVLPKVINNNNPLFTYLGPLVPLLPLGTNLHPESGIQFFSSGSGFETFGSTPDAVPANWLVNSDPVQGLNFGFGNSSVYYLGKLKANGTVRFTYKVKVPINTFGSHYITGMGLARYSPDCPNITDIKKTALTLNVTQSDNCNPPLDFCDQIMFNYKIERNPFDGNKFKITFFDIISGSPNLFSIDKFDIVVHQPYIDKIVSPSPYNKRMIPFKIGTVTMSPSFILTPSIFSEGRRYLTIKNNPTFQNFGFVSFEILSSLPPKLGSEIVFPVNIVFRTQDPCLICERTIYLRYKIRDDLIPVTHISGGEVR